MAVKATNAATITTTAAIAKGMPTGAARTPNKMT